MMLKGGVCDITLLNGKIQELARLAGAQDAARIKSKLQKWCRITRPAIFR